MTSYNTGNPIGSKDPRDLYDNAENLDTAVNDAANDTWSDRLGLSRKTMSGMERQFDAAEDYREAMFVSTQADKQSRFNADQYDRDSRFNTFIASSGYQFLGDYAAGIEITEYNQIVRDGDGNFWRLSGQAELPYTTTGAGLPESDALTPLGDAVLRQQLDDINQGAAILGRGVLAVDSIADLLALPPGQRRSDLRYLVKGHHAGSNVGGGELLWDTLSTEESDGGLIFGDYPSGRWKRIINGPLQASWWGPLAGDEDSWNKLQSALDAAGRLNIDLEISSNTKAYLISKPLVVKGTGFWFPEVRGVGGKVLIEKTTNETSGIVGIYPDRSADVDAVMIVPVIVNQPKFVSIKGIQLRGHQNVTPDFGLWVSITENAHFEDLVATNVGVGFYDDGSWLISFSNCLARSVSVGGFRKNGGTSGRFEQCYVDVSGGYGFYSTSAYVGFHGCAIDKVIGNAYILRGSSGGIAIHNIVIDNCGQEYCSADSVIRLVGAGSINLSIRGSSFFNSTGEGIQTVLPKNLIETKEGTGYNTISIEDVRFVGITDGLVLDETNWNTITIRNVGTSEPSQNKIGSLLDNTRVIEQKNSGLTVSQGYNDEFVRIQAADIIDFDNENKSRVRIRNGQVLARGTVNITREAGQSYGEANIDYPFNLPSGSTISLTIMGSSEAIRTFKPIVGAQFGSPSGTTVTLASANDSISWNSFSVGWIVYGAR